MSSIAARYNLDDILDQFKLIQRALFILLMGSLLTACSDDGMSDLHQFVDEVKAEKHGQVKPLPEFKPFETFVYTADEVKDPFTPWETQVQKVAENDNASKIHPEEHRRKEVLEGFPLGSLLMMGTLEYQNQVWGLIKAPDGIVYRVKKGNYLGQNHGKIEEILRNKMALTEIVPDGLGGWQERQATLSLVGE